MFHLPKNRPNFPQIESDILTMWKDKGIFQKSIDNREGSEDFAFYDGPPFATGTPHYGHMLAGTIKDVIPRYKTMQGYKVERNFGWDCHGLPIENIVEKKLEISGKKDIEDDNICGIHKFNETCRENVFTYANEWRTSVERMGRWVNMDKDYKTMDRDFMESVWQVFKRLYDKGAIYESHRVVPYCTRCSTPLSNFEVNQGYKDIQDKAITVKFAIQDEPGVYILAWTTTPWTLPANLGLAVGEDISYVRLHDIKKNETYILAENLVDKYYKDETTYKILSTISGVELIGTKYTPIIPDFQELAKNTPRDEKNPNKLDTNSYTVVSGHHVTTESGTGIVHIAPAYGEDDAEIGKTQELGFFAHISDTGEVQNLPKYDGQNVWDCNELIIERCKDENKIIKTEGYTHSYPHCWRCENKLIYRAIGAWYVRVEDIRDKMVAANKDIKWTPENVGTGRFGKWLEGARDWNISRNRYWGSAMPVWQSEDKKSEVCIGSVQELYELNKPYGQITEKDGDYVFTDTGNIVDIHKHFVDEIYLQHPESGEKLTRIPEVLDCWFESGSMPYASQHFMGNNEIQFPAEFIAEGLDQTRGWFYTLLILGIHLFDTSPFENVIVNGIILAEDGQKMSKSKQNYPDPNLIFDTYGADSMRFYLMNSPAVKAEALKFSEKGVEEVLKKLILPLWNAYSFFATYANIDNFVPTGQKSTSTNDLDIWIISKLHSLKKNVEENLDDYDLQKATADFVPFLDDLNNWYIRRNRRRFWKGDMDADKQLGYETLHQVLVTFCQVLAPICPYISEHLHGLLTGDESVHLTDWPKYDAQYIDVEKETHYKGLQNIINLGLAYRAKHKIRVRQPLSTLFINQELSKEDKEILKEELNIKKIGYISDIETYATVSYAPDARKIGQSDRKRYMKEILAKAKTGDVIMTTNGELTLQSSDDTIIQLTADEFEVRYTPKESTDMDFEAGFGMVIGIDAHLTEELTQEGYARDLVRFIQEARKTGGFDVVDRLLVHISGSDELIQTFTAFAGLITTETLCTLSDNEQASKTAVELDALVGTISLGKHV